MKITLWRQNVEGCLILNSNQCQAEALLRVLMLYSFSPPGLANRSHEYFSVLVEAEKQ